MTPTPPRAGDARLTREQIAERFWHTQWSGEFPPAKPDDGWSDAWDDYETFRDELAPIVLALLEQERDAALLAAKDACWQRAVVYRDHPDTVLASENEGLAGEAERCSQAIAALRVKP